MLGKDLGCGKKKRAYNEFSGNRRKAYEEISMKTSLCIPLSFSLFNFFSPVSLFFNLYLEVFYFCGFHDFFLLTSAYIFICPLCQSLILQTETLSLQCSIIYSSLFIQFFFFSVCVKCHIVRLLSFLLASLALIERLSRTNREIANFVLSLS